MKTITVREYDQIYTGFRPEFTKELLDAFCDFIEEYSSDKNNTEEDNILNFANISFKKNIGKVISLKNYVGVIQLKNKIQIQVLPKINFDKSDDDFSKTKSVFLKMLRTLKDFKAKSFLTTNLDITKMNIYDIFISMYLNNVSELITKGLKKDYELVQDNINFIKGRFLIHEQIKHNFVNKHKFYCEFDEYSLNRPEHKLIKSALLKLERYSNNSKNKMMIKRLLISLDLVNPSFDFKSDYKSIHLTNDMNSYKSILDWTMMFLMNNSFTSFVGKSESKSLLFPMEKIFESYVGKLVKRTYIPLGYDVSLQDKSYHLFDKPARFQLKPDIVMRKDNKLIILDTKWKRLVDNPCSDYGVANSDMYQMFAYSKKYQCENIYLVYPYVFDFDKEVTYNSLGTKVHLKQIKLDINT